MRVKCWSRGKINRSWSTGIVFHISAVLCNLYSLIQFSASAMGSSLLDFAPVTSITTRLTTDQCLSKNFWKDEIHTSLYPGKSPKGTPPPTPREYDSTRRPFPSGRRLESQQEHPSRLNVQDSISVWTYLPSIPKAGWEFTYGELLQLKWWVITSPWRSYTGWLSPSNISLPLFKEGSPTLPTSLLDMLSCVPSTTSRACWEPLGINATQ